MRTTSFEKFYYERVALSESCGCAEQVINIRDLDALAMQRDGGRHIAGLAAALVRLFRRRTRPDDHPA